MKKSMTLILVAMLSVLLLTACECKHDWKQATCDTPMTCSKCGETYGETLVHDYAPATCLAPETCQNCGKTQGEMTDHNWEEATCKKAKTCTVCQKTEGKPLDHEPKTPTCLMPSTCKNCSRGLPVTGHQFVNPTVCGEKMRCSACGATEGKPKGHAWQPATAEKPKTCKLCGKTEGTVLRLNLGITVSEFAEKMNTALSAQGKQLKYQQTLEDEKKQQTIYTYEVYPANNALTYANVRIRVTTAADSTDVWNVTIETSGATDTTATTLLGNCLGIAAVLVDETFDQKDIDELKKGYQITYAPNYTYITYSHIKEGYAYELVYTYDADSNKCRMLDANIYPAEHPA